MVGFGRKASDGHWADWDIGVECMSVHLQPLVYTLQQGLGWAGPGHSSTMAWFWYNKFEGGWV